MKRVLIIGPDFTPSSLPPALRIQGFVNHLPEFGWEPTVLTVDPSYYDWMVDDETTQLLHESVKVVRTTALPAGLLRKIGVGDIALRSFWQVWRTAVKLCQTNQFDLVFIPVPPNYQSLIGRLLNARFGLPYIIDYIDPWTSIDYWNLPRWRRPLKRTASYCLARMLEPIVLKRASHITGVSKGTTDHVVRKFGMLTPADTTEIPYGGDSETFEYLKKHPRSNAIFDKHDGFIHLSYIGACNDGMKPTLRALLEGVRIGRERNRELFDRLRLHFVGTTYAPDPSGQSQVIAIADEVGVADLVDEHPGRVSYLDALQLLLDSNALLILGSDAPHYTASKIFPYILAAKPLVVFFHEASSLVPILQETNSGEAVTFSQNRPPSCLVQEVSKRLETILCLPPDHKPATRWDSFDAYTCRSMTSRLTQAFEKSLRSAPSRQSLLEIPIS